MHHKALAAHFKKAAHHHEKMADHHEKCMKAHEAHAECHEEHMGKGGDEQYHKKSAQFHKSMAGHHEKLHKSHATHAEHLHKMCEACTETDNKKVAKLLELEEGELDTMSKAEDTPIQTPEVKPTPVADPKPVQQPLTKMVDADGNIIETPQIDFNELYRKALETKTAEAITNSVERVLGSDDFNKKVDQLLAQRMLEKLGSTSVDTTIRTFPVARPGEKIIKTQGGGKIGVDPALAHLVSFDTDYHQ